MLPSSHSRPAKLVFQMKLHCTGLFSICLMLIIGTVSNNVVRAQEKKEPEKPKLLEGGPAPELDGGVAWLNTGKPLKLKDLRGKIVLLDFWTLCCINCIHIMPDLARLEEKYKNELVVIGIHSGKFENEKNSESIRKAILRYELKHPVVNDAERKIWNTYGADWWPTIVLIDPEGKVIGGRAGEMNFNIKEIDQSIAKLIQIHRKKKTLNETPIRFDTATFRDQPDTPLYFPGKVLVDNIGKRILIADSTHHRIVVTDMNGKKIAIAGTGQPGARNGAFDQAQFDDPQGMAVREDIVYVADRKNNLIRRLDLKSRMVTTVAGNGKQAPILKNVGGFAPETALNSPWDLWLDGNRLMVAMAGSHQIWVLKLRERIIGPAVGAGGENLLDGPPATALFAQPSGLTSDGKNLYVADCEVVPCVKCRWTFSAKSKPWSVAACLISAIATALVVCPKVAIRKRKCSCNMLSASLITTARSMSRIPTTARSSPST